MRHLQVAVAIVVTLGGLSLAFATSVIGIDSSDESTIRADNEIQDRTGGSPDYERKRLVKCWEIRAALVDELISGQTTLKQVSEVFVVLNDLNPLTEAALFKDLPNASAEVRAARQVIQYVRCRLDDKPFQRQIVVDELERQFQAMHGNGSVTGLE